MKEYPLISIVTPSYNHAEYLEETILSVISQNYPNLEYIIIDGGSTDGSIDIIKKYEKSLKYWISEADNGLYDALNKGFKKSTGEIMGWLNSDDILHRQSLFVIADIFASQKHVKWLQGYPTVIDGIGSIVSHRRPRFSKYSFYIKEYHDGIFIQQESTYWRRNLWSETGGHISQEYKYAGDFELWIRFYKYAELHITSALIGAFRIRSGQISEVYYKSYLQECDMIIEKAINTFNSGLRTEIRKLRTLKKIQQRLPLISKLLFVSRFIRKIEGTAKEVLFNFKDQQFY